MQPVYLEKKGNTKIVSHRGLSGVELENTLAAFVAAGNLLFRHRNGRPRHRGRKIRHPA